MGPSLGCGVGMCGLWPHGPWARYFDCDIRPRVEHATNSTCQVMYFSSQSDIEVYI